MELTLKQFKQMWKNGYGCRKHNGLKKVNNWKASIGDLKLVVTTLQKPERFYQDADRRNFRTKRVNEAVRLIRMLDKGFR